MVDSDIQASNESASTTQLNIPEHVFRAYDIRGLVGDELNPSAYYAIGQAVGSQLNQQKTFVVGYDGRLSSVELAESFIKGLLSTGTDVIDVGLVPSPILYFAIGALGCTSGAIVTGSHNPKEYNGLKIVIDNNSLTSEQLEALKEQVYSGSFTKGQGHYQQAEVVERYISKICQQLTLSKPIKIAIDCGNGVAGNMAPALFRALGAEVVELYCDVDGHFPNHHPDPSVSDNLIDLIEVVKAQQCDLGFAFDGDADRLGVVTGQGEIIWPDRQLILLAQDFLKKHPAATVVFDVKCTALLEKAILSGGGTPLMCPTGHAIVKKVMRDNNVLLAGEMSGHIFIKDEWNGFDDALYAGARLLQILTQAHDSIQAQFDALPNTVNTPEIKIDVPEHMKFGLMSHIISSWQFSEGEVLTIDGLRWQTTNGWGLIRASNTTPCLVLRFEADTPYALQRIQQAFEERLSTLPYPLHLPNAHRRT